MTVRLPVDLLAFLPGDARVCVAQVDLGIIASMAVAKIEELDATGGRNLLLVAIEDFARMRRRDELQRRSAFDVLPFGHKRGDLGQVDLLGHVARLEVGQSLLRTEWQVQKPGEQRLGWSKPRSGRRVHLFLPSTKPTS